MSDNRAEDQAAIQAVLDASYKAWAEGDADAMVGWARETWSRISEFGTGTTYLNFTGLSEETTETGVDAAFGAKLERLAKIKAHYDPGNFFHRNNNIAPAA